MAYLQTPNYGHTHNLGQNISGQIDYWHSAPLPPLQCCFFAINLVGCHCLASGTFSGIPPINAKKQHCKWGEGGGSKWACIGMIVIPCAVMSVWCIDPCLFGYSGSWNLGYGRYFSAPQYFCFIIFFQWILSTYFCPRL